MPEKFYNLLDEPRCFQINRKGDAINGKARDSRFFPCRGMWSFTSSSVESSTFQKDESLLDNLNATQVSFSFVSIMWSMKSISSKQNHAPLHRQVSKSR